LGRFIPNTGISWEVERCQVSVKTSSAAARKGPVLAVEEINAKDKFFVQSVEK
jgi:hypothetical protein